MEIQSSTMDHTMKLPDEVMVAVLEYVPVLDLPRCAMVCQRWRRLASDESLWARVYLEVDKMPFRKLAKIIEHGVRDLEIYGQIVGSPEGAFKPDFKSPLRVLDVTATRIMAKSMYHILQTTSELRELRIGLAPSLDKRCILAIGRNPNLEILDLSHAENFDPTWMYCILRSCQKLKELNLESTRLKGQAVKTLIANLPGTLTDLNLNDVGTHLQDHHVAEIVRKCPNLEYLDIGNNKNITPEAVKIASKLEHLKSLDTEKDVDSDEDEWQDEDDYENYAGLLHHFLGDSDDSDDDLDESDALEQWMRYKDAKERDDGSDIFYLMNLDRIYNPGMHDGLDDSDDSDD